MTEAVEIGDAHTRVRLHSVEDPYQDGFQFRNFTVDIEAPGITATSGVTNTEDGVFSLARYFDGLGEDWRGWNGERKWEALEHELAISATHDRQGHVTLSFFLRESPYPGAWTAGVAVTIDAGEALLHLARDIHGFFQV